MKHEPTQSWRDRGARLGVGGVAILLAIMTSVFGALNGNLFGGRRADDVDPTGHDDEKTHSALPRLHQRLGKPRNFNRDGGI